MSKYRDEKGRFRPGNPHRFKPGVVTNPRGRPRTRHLYHAMRTKFREPIPGDPEGRTYLEFFRSIATGRPPSRANAKRAFALMVDLGPPRRFHAVLRSYGVDPDEFLQRVADAVLQTRGLGFRVPRT